MTPTVPISVVETPEFLATTRKLMTDEDRAVLVDYLAYNPTAGVLIPSSGGVRKLRWGLEGRGKRGGARCGAAIRLGVRDNQDEGGRCRDAGRAVARPASRHR